MAGARPAPRSCGGSPRARSRTRVRCPPGAWGLAPGAGRGGLARPGYGMGCDRRLLPCGRRRALRRPPLALGRPPRTRGAPGRGGRYHSVPGPVAVITLVLGGARSGKSAVAERRACALAGGAGAVAYVATAIPGNDADFAERIRAHQDRRPAHWVTVEAGDDLVGALGSLDENTVALVDSLGTWVAAQPDLAIDVGGLVTVLRARAGPSVLVSDEVGLGVQPSNETRPR